MTRRITRLSDCLAMAIVVLQMVGVSSALAQASLPHHPTEPEQPIAPSNSSTISPTIELQTAPELPQSSPTSVPNGSVSQQPALACPPGQFASAFPDVTPSDWAYEAVNRLAALEIRCFPFPPQP